MKNYYHLEVALINMGIGAFHNRLKEIRKAVKADLKAEKKLKKAQKRKKQQSAYMRSQP